jgi:hypothetical protein
MKRKQTERIENLSSKYDVNNINEAESIIIQQAPT